MYSLKLILQLEKNQKFQKELLQLILTILLILKYLPEKHMVMD
jgi:hypothetical protein